MCAFERERVCVFVRGRVCVLAYVVFIIHSESFVSLPSVCPDWFHTALPRGLRGSSYGPCSVSLCHTNLGCRSPFSHEMSVN